MFSFKRKFVGRNQGYKDDYSICGAYLSLAYAGQRKHQYFYTWHSNNNDCLEEATF